MTVHIVEHDASTGQWISELIQSIGLQSTVYPTADVFLANMDLPSPSCLVLNMLLPGMTGLE